MSKTINDIMDELVKTNKGIDEIKSLIKPFMQNVTVEKISVPAGSFFYRARKVENGFSKSHKLKTKDLQYPQKHQSRVGRANRAKQSVLYCSFSKEPVFFELSNLINQSEIILGFWQTLKEITLINIGYTEAVFKEHGASRSIPSWIPTNVDIPSGSSEIVFNQSSLADGPEKEFMLNDKNREIKEALSKAFMCKVGDNEIYKYNLTNAIAELHMEKFQNSSIQIDGIIYPSSRMWANGDNIALAISSCKEDVYLKFKKALHIRIDNKIDNGQEKRVAITNMDHANIATNGNKLAWRGCLPPIVQLKQHERGRIVLEAGIDEDGDYQFDKNGVPCNWVVY